MKKVKVTDYNPNNNVILLSTVLEMKDLNQAICISYYLKLGNIVLAKFLIACLVFSQTHVSINSFHPQSFL